MSERERECARACVCACVCLSVCLEEAEEFGVCLGKVFYEGVG